MPNAQAVIQSLGQFGNTQGVNSADLAGRYDDGSGGGLFMYWKKPADSPEPGFIVIDGGHPVDLAEFSKRGFTPLWKYGQFEDFDKSAKWDMRRDPWRRILELGGAEEFPIEQILEFGWHKRPPRKGVVFPQLAGIEVEEHKCSYCRRVFRALEDLQRHESIAHTTTSQQTQLARHLADANTGVLKDVLTNQQALMDRMAANEERTAQALELLALAIGGQAPAKPAAPAPAPAAPAVKR